MTDAVSCGRKRLSRRVVERLRANGHDVALVAGTFSGISDPEVLKLAETDARILITEDRDFGDLVVRQRLNVGGVILLELDRLSNDAEADRVAEVVAVHVDRLANNLIVIEPARVRVRPLPSPS
jgi:predicted nuclease of predicted toxin-antitoxin system